MSKPIITPAKFLDRGSVPPELEGCSLAVVGFCRFGEMKRKLSAEPLPERIFSHLGLAHEFVGKVEGAKFLALECLYGGPVSATVIEELAHFGVKTVVGYGYAGSLTRDIPIGQIVLAEAAFVSDGTSREYLPDAELVYPDGGLAERFRRCAAGRGVSVREAKVWTTDAIYREYPEKVAAWRETGAGVVNMDTAHFYAVSNVVGIAAVYACVVSDCVEGPKWDDGFERIAEATGALQDLVVGMVTRL